MECWDWAKKISSARFFQATTSGALPLFVTGSWDEAQNDIAVWRCGVNVRDAPEMLCSLQDQGQALCGNAADICPLVLAPGFGMALGGAGGSGSQSATQMLLVASSSGRVRRFVYIGSDLDDSTGSVLQETDDLPSTHRGAATSVHFCSESGQVASGADDGSVCVRDLGASSAAYSLVLGSGKAAVRSVRFKSATELLLATASRAAPLQLWDCRASPSSAAITFAFGCSATAAAGSGALAGVGVGTNANMGRTGYGSISEGNVSAGCTCVASNEWLVAGGSDDGCIALWDIRRPAAATTGAAGNAMHVAQGHLGVARDVRFVTGSGSAPASLVSCGDDGRVLRWRIGATRAMESSTAGGMGMGTSTGQQLELCGEPSWSGIGALAGLPLNALDTDLVTGLLLAASDAQFFVCMTAELY
eukprot:g2005.t1